MVNRFFRPPALIGQCILCGDAGQPGLDICLPCLRELPVIHHCCQQCALSLSDPASLLCGLCVQNKPPFSRARALWHYQAPIAQLISGFKYNRRYSFGNTLAIIMADSIVSAHLHGEMYRPSPDLIIPTPLHWYRRLRRGFNQSEQLACVLSERLNIPMLRAIKRRKATPPQQSLNAQQRKNNLRKAFEVTDDIRNLHVAVVDDVMTTGATATEISHCLLDAGAREVEIWCLARTPR